MKTPCGSKTDQENWADEHDLVLRICPTRGLFVCVLGVIAVGVAVTDGDVVAAVAFAAVVVLFAWLSYRGWRSGL